MLSTGLLIDRNTYCLSPAVTRMSEDSPYSLVLGRGWEEWGRGFTQGESAEGKLGMQGERNSVRKDGNRVIMSRRLLEALPLFLFLRV